MYLTDGLTDGKFYLSGFTVPELSRIQFVCGWPCKPFTNHGTSGTSNASKVRITLIPCDRSDKRRKALNFGNTGISKSDMITGEMRKRHNKRLLKMTPT